MSRRLDLALAFALGALLFAVFYASPHLTLSDSKYSMLLAEHLLVERSFVLDRYFWPHVDSSDYPKVRDDAVWPRHVQPGGRLRRASDEPIEAPLYYVYPPGTSILSVPLVAAARAAGISTIDADGRYDVVAEARIQKLSAAFLMALAGGLFYLTARLLLDIGPSLLVALGGALGTSLWSTASRALWSHTWDVVLLALALGLLLRAEVGRSRLRPAALGALLGLLFCLGYYVRPTAALYVAPLTLYAAWRHRRAAPWLLGTGALGLGLFLAYSQAHFGTWLPDYYTSGGGSEASNLRWAGHGLAASLVAPSRGLFVYSPVMLFVGYLLVTYRRRLRHRGLLAALLAACALHVFVVSAFASHWWQGTAAYGPRFLTDLVPVFVLLAVLGARAALDARAAGEAAVQRRRLEAAGLAVSLVLSVVIHGAGAASDSGRRWNEVPVEIKHDPMRVFDPRRPQWLCALFPQLLPEPVDPAVIDELKREKRERRKRRRADG